MTTAAAAPGEITRQMLRGGRRALTAWAAAFAALVALYAVIWPSIRGNNRWQELFNTLPQTYRAIFTAGGQLDLSTPAGYLGIELMGFLGPALMAVYAISTGASAIAGEEGRGGLEVTLSAPVARGRMLAERAAALLIDLTAVAATAGLAMGVFSLAFGMHLGVAAIASAAALGVFGFFTGAAALAMGVATGSAALARGLAALVAVASYLINALAQATGTLKPARPLSPFYLLFGNEPLQHGLRAAGALSVLAVSFALLAVGADSGQSAYPRGCGRRVPVAPLMLPVLSITHPPTCNQFRIPELLCPAARHPESESPGLAHGRRDWDQAPGRAGLLHAAPPAVPAAD